MLLRPDGNIKQKLCTTSQYLNAHAENAQVLTGSKVILSMRGKELGRSMFSRGGSLQFLFQIIGNNNSTS